MALALGRGRGQSIILETARGLLRLAFLGLEPCGRARFSLSHVTPSVSKVYDAGEPITIDTDDGPVRITYLGPNLCKHARLSIDAPQAVRIWREEIYRPRTESPGAG